MGEKRNDFYVFIIFLFSIIFSSCKKENSSVVFSDVSSGTESNLYSVRKLNGDTIIACGGKDNHGIMLLSADKGNSWSKLNDSFDQVIYDVYFINGHLGFAGGGTPDVFKTNDGGKNWEKLSLPFPLTGFPLNYRTPLRKIFFVNDSLGFICGGGRFEAGIIFKTTDQGATWTLTTFNYELRGILFLTEQTGFACGYGIMLKTTDSGNTWNAVSSPDEYYTAVEKNEAEIWTSGYNGGIYKTNEDNIVWQSACSGNNAFSARTHFSCLAVSDNGTLVAAGNDGIIAVSNDHGATWNNGESFNHATIKNILLIDDKSGIAVGNDGKIFNFSF
jgi:photosystem II stability/assembly factor-like uncharacterized protein